MPTVHMICGPLGSGKTTFARRLERQLTALRFTHDEWMVRLYGQDPPADRFPEYAERVSTMVNTFWPKCLEMGWDVILDFDFWKRSERDAIRGMAAKHGAATILYWLETPKAMAWQRVERRNSEPNTLFIAPATFEALWPQFEPPDPDEGARLIADLTRPAV